jgi:hypothetical protein
MFRRILLLTAHPGGKRAFLLAHENWPLGALLDEQYQLDKAFVVAVVVHSVEEFG